MGRGGAFSVDSLGGVYVLVVDGEKDRRALLTGVLRYCGALVTAVASADSACAVIDVLKPDVVVVDFLEPADAVRLLERLRTLNDTVGAVATVAVGASGFERLARDRGFDAYVEQPFDPWELCRVISTLVTI